MVLDPIDPTAHAQFGRWHDERWYTFGFGVPEDHRRFPLARQTHDALGDLLTATTEQGSQQVGGIFVHIHPHDEAPPVFTYRTEMPYFDAPLNRAADAPERCKFVFCWVTMTPRTFLRLTAAASAVSWEKNPRTASVKAFTKHVRRDIERGGEYITALRAAVRAGAEGDPEVPAPVLELDRNANVRGMQEGRTRAVLADELGIRRVNVLLAANWKKTDGWRPADAREEA